LRVSRPIEVVVLNCWVTETNETPWASNSSTSLAKFGQRPRQAVDLIDDDDIQSSGGGYRPGRTLCRSGRSVDPPEYPPSSYRDRNKRPAGMGLAFDIGKAGVVLRPED